MLGVFGQFVADRGIAGDAEARPLDPALFHQLGQARFEPREDFGGGRPVRIGFEDDEEARRAAVGGGEDARG